MLQCIASLTSNSFYADSTNGHLEYLEYYWDTVKRGDVDVPEISEEGFFSKDFLSCNQHSLSIGTINGPLTLSQLLPYVASSMQYQVVHIWISCPHHSYRASCPIIVQMKDLFR